MKSIFLAAIGCLALTTPTLAMSDADCAAMWKQADTDNDGSLSAAESSRYMAWKRVKNEVPPPGDTMDKDQFLKDCKADVFTTAAVDEGAPLEGANSFTEGQAKDRVAAAGYSDVSALAKDDKGIWRGSASKDGKPVKVAVDYKGNVVSN